MRNIDYLQQLLRRCSQAIKSHTFYPRAQPLPRTRSFWIALGLVSLLVTAYSIYFCIFLLLKQNAFQTNGEDLGIMDQALWNLLHGSLLHQTICNILTDTNCYGVNGISRFAIHFEPILFPTSLLYLFWPSPKTLMIFQVLVVASGAFPAFWLARLRLRSNWAAVPFALLYLLYPAQQYAVNFDFHAETLTISLLLFTFYFLYMRKTVWVFVFVVLCLSCKEEIAGVIFMLGLWTLLLQRRWRIGSGMIALALGWTALGLLVVHYFSPIGHSLLATRYAYLGNGSIQIVLTLLTHPIAIIKAHLLEHSHMLYLRDLLAPAAYLPILAPWILVLAAPTIALNLLSSTPNMYSGNFQYNAEIVPILIFASIEATVLIMWLTGWLLATQTGRGVTSRAPVSPTLIMWLAGWLQTIQTGRGVTSRAPVSPRAWVREGNGRTRGDAPTHEVSSGTRAYGRTQGDAPTHGVPAKGWRRGQVTLQAGILILVLCSLLLGVLRSSSAYNVYSVMPYAKGFIWPQVTAHDQLAAHFLAEIPNDASVSTQTNLVPHLSERRSIYLFPYAVGDADYILLDAPGYTYPFQNYNDYASTVKAILQHGTYGVVDLDDGYILLQRGFPSSDVAAALHTINASAHNAHTND